MPEAAWVGIVELSAVTALTSPWSGHDLRNIGTRGLRRPAAPVLKKTHSKKKSGRKPRMEEDNLLKG